MYGVSATHEKQSLVNRALSTVLDLQHFEQKVWVSRAILNGISLNLSHTTTVGSYGHICGQKVVVFELWQRDQHDQRDFEIRTRNLCFNPWSSSPTIAYKHPIL